MHTAFFCVEGVADIFLPLPTAKPYLRASLLAAPQGFGSVGDPHYRGERTGDQADLIITSFSQAFLPQWHRHDHLHGPVELGQAVCELGHQGLTEAKVAAVLELV